ncbi:ULK kinase, putative [Eimeria tenella]|uniref:ULK kinase, putative n=1 Tax=Eimeria tenella TaxID=5802 RepID=U6KZ57_EIMTE|nr:ULK kinase, putative [Eimeria tenella]CDJ41609.1 ULK kinase, putative [Eimeria tenella]|eukprot:XP_013232359.1 ULK kinase, putative [Eimeria tenella]
MGSRSSSLRANSGVSYAKKSLRDSTKQQQQKQQQQQQQQLQQQQLLLQQQQQQQEHQPLRHPSIISFYGSHEDEKYYYGVFELCGGRNLFGEICRWNSFSEFEAVGLVKQMLSAVKYMHENGFVHRDIKAENFMFRTELELSSLLMIDFGLATKITKGETLDVVCGSPRYIAPEVLRRSYSEKCDLWSLGVIVYLLLFGFHPFGDWKGASFEDIADEVLNAEVAFLPKWGVQPPSEKATEFLKGLLTRDLRRRLSAADALKHPWLEADSAVLQQTLVDPAVRAMAKEVLCKEKTQMETIDIEETL